MLFHKKSGASLSQQQQSTIIPFSSMDRIFSNGHLKSVGRSNKITHFIIQIFSHTENDVSKLF